jgi:hypothetical protein
LGCGTKLRAAEAPVVGLCADLRGAGGTICGHPEEWSGVVRAADAVIRTRTAER